MLQVWPDARAALHRREGARTVDCYSAPGARSLMLSHSLPSPPKEPCRLPEQRCAILSMQAPRHVTVSVRSEFLHGEQVEKEEGSVQTKILRDKPTRCRVAGVHAGAARREGRAPWRAAALPDDASSVRRSPGRPGQQGGARGDRTGRGGFDVAAIFGRFQDQQSQQGHRQFYRAQARLRRMGKHCYPSGVDSNWVEYAVDELSAAGASRLCVVGCLRRISAATPVFLGRDGSHRDGGPHKMALRNFLAQVRQQGAVFRLDTTSQRSGTLGVRGRRRRGCCEFFGRWHEVAASQITRCGSVCCSNEMRSRRRAATVCAMYILFFGIRFGDTSEENKNAVVGLHAMHKRRAEHLLCAQLGTVQHPDWV